MDQTCYEVIEVVDADDNVIGTEFRGEVHRKRLMHRAAHVFLFNKRGEIYVQLRSANKDNHPGKLDSSAAGHVEPGESYRQTAVRELDEEIGIRADVAEVLRFPATEITDNEHTAVFEAFSDSKPIPNSDEIEWARFMTKDELTSMMEESPESFVPGFILLWKEYLREKSENCGSKGLAGDRLR
jgi:isopentenyl-diphosphate delta-isomerase type 1